MRNFFIPHTGNDHKPYLLRNGALLVYTLVLFFVNAFSGLLGLSQVSASSITSANIISLSNEERETFGLDRLTSNSQLTSAAIAKANNMFQEQYWDHFGPNGETPWQFIKESGYKYVYAGENLAKGFKTAEGVVQAWMASPTHRENLLSGNYTEIGVATVSGELLGENVVLVVQMFGNRTNDVSESVKPTTVVPDVEEEGEIKSIKIIYPAQDDVINDAGVDIKGQVNGVDGEYTVSIIDESEDVGEVESDESDWVFSKNGDWTEGEHSVTASLRGDAASDSVDFTIDSRGPDIKEDTLSVVRQNGAWEVSVQIEDENPSVSMVSGDNTILVTDEEDTFTATIEDNQLGNKTVIIASDKHGNTSELDITAMFQQDQTPDIIGSISNMINGIDVRTTFNILFAAFILALLGTETYVFLKKGMLAKKAGTLMTIGIWWLMLVIGIANGFSGVIS